MLSERTTISSRNVFFGNLPIFDQQSALATCFLPNNNNSVAVNRLPSSTTMEKTAPKSLSPVTMAKQSIKLETLVLSDLLNPSLISGLAGNTPDGSGTLNTPPVYGLDDLRSLRYVDNELLAGLGTEDSVNLNDFISATFDGEDEEYLIHDLRHDIKSQSQDLVYESVKSSPSESEYLFGRSGSFSCGEYESDIEDAVSPQQIASAGCNPFALQYQLGASGILDTQNLALALIQEPRQEQDSTIFINSATIGSQSQLVTISVEDLGDLDQAYVIAPDVGEEVVPEEIIVEELDVPETVTRQEDISCLVIPNKKSRAGRKPAAESNATSFKASAPSKNRGGARVAPTEGHRRRVGLSGLSKESPEYKEKRERNNVSVRKSRDKARQRQDETETKLQLLSGENQRLQDKVDSLEKELSILRGLFGEIGSLPIASA